MVASGVEVVVVRSGLGPEVDVAGGTVVDGCGGSTVVGRRVVGDGGTETTGGTDVASLGAWCSSLQP